MIRGAAVLFLAVMATLDACAGHRDRDPPAARNSGPLYSPNGEPLSGGRLDHPNCQEALAGWFDRVAANHAGTIDLAVFLADASRQFAAMDIDHDGQLTSDELTRYRAAYMDESRMAEAAPDDDTLRPDQSAPRQGEGKGSARGGGGPGGRGGNGPRGLPGEQYGVSRGDKGGAGHSPRDTARDRPDPVMIADVTLHGRVSLAEFLAYERQNFAELDVNRDGRLSKDELTRSCPKP